MPERTAAIVVIGNEILNGKSEDQNARFLIGELYRLGVSLRRIVIIPDVLDEISAAVRECSEKFDYVFTSGGVGPTHDDVTIEGVARALNRRVVRNPRLESLIRNYFGAAADEPRLRMADVPENAELVGEQQLRWPVLAAGNVFVLPGVPEHFRSKFEAIRERFRIEPFHSRAVFTRQDEFDLAISLSRVASEHPAVEIGSYPNFQSSEYRVKITLESKEQAAVELALAALLKSLEPALIARTE
ncbi:MAG: competence/damage-inducible protein A [Blastocatellia bacterium AA13]|nr:MAG: competence/damage-inducible protein A [Blastocatellia bacterium AA13]